MAKALARHDDPRDAGRQRSTAGGSSERKAKATARSPCSRSPRSLCVAASSSQRALTLEPWPATAPIRVRIAVHTGPAQARGHDFYGPGINRAARLRSVAHGGQLIISGDVHRCVASTMPKDAWLVDLGLHRLKDLAEPEHVWQIGQRDIAADFPPLTSLEAAGHNLPVQLTAFVGRDEELMVIHKRLETAPLLTLVGPGGIGKTRLALQVAADATDEFPDGVWLVELAAVTDPYAITPAIADALSVREEPGTDLLATIVGHLVDRRALLIIDNCEHQIDEAARVVHEILRGAANVRVLATSREPLAVYGEAVYAVPTLEVPQAGTAFPEEALASDSVRLFVDRAALVQHGFSVGEETERVVEICVRLEGIPLAIELAAALVRTATPSEVAARLADRLDALATGPRTAPERHRTLRAAIESSYDILPEAERGVFGQLSVFAGGFTLGSAAAVCEGADDIARAVERLADRSLIQARTTERGTRHVMLETIRDFASEKVDPATSHAAEQRHTRWALDFITSKASKLWSPEAAATIGAIDDEHDNLRAALTRTIDAEPDVAADIVTSIHVYWFTVGYLTDGREWSRRAAAATTDPRRRTRLHLYEAQFASAQGDPGAMPLVEKAVADARELGELEVAALGLNIMSGAAIQAGRLADAKDMASESLTLLRRVGQPRNVVQSLNVLGVIATMEGDDASAYSFYEDALAVSREIGMTETIARLLLNLGNLAVSKSEYEKARSYYEEVRELAGSVSDAVGLSAATTNLGVIAKTLGDLTTARETLNTALEMKRELGDGRGIVVALLALAEVEMLEEHNRASHDLVLEALQMCEQIEFSAGLIQGLEYAATLLERSGEADVGLRVASAADATRRSTGQKRSPEDQDEFDGLVGKLRAPLGEGADNVWASGADLDLPAAVALVRETPTPTRSV